MRVGWIGLGQMGAPMALRVRQAGHEVTGHARSKPHDALAAAGIAITASTAQAVRDADVVGVCLFDDAQTHRVLVDDGVLAAMKPGAVLAVHTTGTATAIEALAAAAPAGIAILDATFSGTAQDAERGEVRLFVGGDAGALETARPMLSAYCDPIFAVGPIGAARKLKLVNNLLFAAQISLAAEALKALEALGIGRQMAVEALSLSSGSSFAMKQFARGEVDMIVERLAHYLDKDVNAARSAATDAGIALSLAMGAAARWGTA